MMAERKLVGTRAERPQYGPNWLAAAAFGSPRFYLTWDDGNEEEVDEETYRRARLVIVTNRAGYKRAE